MRPTAIAALFVATALAGSPATGLGAGSDEPPPPRPTPKPQPKPDPKPAPKDAGKEAPRAAPDAAAASDYAAGKAAVAQARWKEAIALLERAAERDPGNANIHNQLGFAYRNDGDWERAFGHYRAALAANPQHRGTHEYLGRAYLLRGNLRLAQAHLTRLERICGRGCEEYASLSGAIEDQRRLPR
ncbi:MAG: tetratricopeptide repeat protein [Burkholderiales bacterium]|nr:tetratricopeptide repeat protein [Burkholderiales bacterium]